jgi:preprotein translocase subunit SecY
VASLFHKVRAVAMRDILLFLLLIVILLLILSRIRVPRKDHEQDQDHEQETIDRAGLARKVAALQLPPV